MAYRAISIRGRSSLMAITANNLLNVGGQAIFFRGHYWRIHYTGFLTHEILDRTEKNLAELIQKSEYRK